MDLLTVTHNAAYHFSRLHCFRAISWADRHMLSRSVSPLAGPTDPAWRFSSEQAGRVLMAARDSDRTGATSTLSLWSRRRAEWVGLVQLASQADRVELRLRCMEPARDARVIAMLSATLALCARLLPPVDIGLRVPDPRRARLLDRWLVAGPGLIGADSRMLVDRQRLPAFAGMLGDLRAADGFHPERLARLSQIMRSAR